MDLIELERGMLMTMPGGWKMSQVEAQFPTTTYGEFKREILNEIARCLNMPFNVAAGNSSGYNYASGRLDHQVYYIELLHCITKYDDVLLCYSIIIRHSHVYNLCIYIYLYIKFLSFYTVLST